MKDINTLISKKTSSFMKKVSSDVKNRDWQDFSAVIALKILQALDEKKISQAKLARDLGVKRQYINKILKGNENLSLKTIVRVQNSLNISLLQHDLEMPKGGSAREITLDQGFLIGNNVFDMERQIKLYSKVLHAQDSVYRNPFITSTSCPYGNE